jgi:cellobiose phosphorylase
MPERLRYGYFDNKAREFVITRPDTPLPWINYLGCQDYLGLISNTAGGYSFYRDARLRRLTRYHYNVIPKDIPGRYIYICDGKKTWNPGFKPAKTKLDDYKCRHGLGYTVIEGALNGLRVSTTYFVPIGTNAEVWSVAVKNESRKVKDIDLFSYAEFCLYDALDDATNFQRNWNIAEVEIENSAIFHKTEYRERRNHYVFFWSSEKIAGFDTMRDAFIGRLNDYGCPDVVKRRSATNSVAHSWQPIGSHQVKLSVKPGQTKRLHFVLGYIENPQEEKFAAPNVINKKGFYEAIANLKTSAQVDKRLNELKKFWADALSGYQVKIDNPHVERMVNVWNQYQCMVTFNLSRSASSFETGVSRGLGFRDSNQDILGFVHIVPERARQRIIDLASTQNHDGSCYHQYQPLTKKGNAAVGTGFSDDPLWLIVSTAAYIKENGDWSILDAPAGYQSAEASASARPRHLAGSPNGGDVPDSEKSTTLMDHLHLSMKHVMDLRGSHGLPLIQHADWNDCLNLNCFSNSPGESFQTSGDIEGGKAESVMVAQLFVYAAGEMCQMLEHLGQKDKSGDYAKKAYDMKGAILKSGWDGNWFVRAYDHFEQPIGSKACDEGKIFIETQGWGVMAGIGLDDGKALSALDSAWKYLADENGMVLNQPAYTKYQDRLGEISSYPPGYKENASIFCHNNTWVIIGETILGRGDKAWELYKRICPSTKEDVADNYKCEPYCFAQTISGHDSPLPGEAKNSWLTGTASWSFVALSQYILGIRAELDGLRIDPCIPPEWSKFAVTRKFRGATYNIKVLNPDKVMRGVKKMLVNGKEHRGNVVEVFKKGSVVNVEVYLG